MSDFQIQDGFSYNPSFGDVAATSTAMLMYNKPSILQSAALSHCCLTSVGVVELAQAPPHSAESLLNVQICGYSPQVDSLLPLIESIDSTLHHSRNPQLRIAVGGHIHGPQLSPSRKSIIASLPHLGDSVNVCGVSLRKRNFKINQSKRVTQTAMGGDVRVVQIFVTPVRSWY